MSTWSKPSSRESISSLFGEVVSCQGIQKCQEILSKCMYKIKSRLLLYSENRTGFSYVCLVEAGPKPSFRESISSLFGEGISCLGIQKAQELLTKCLYNKESTSFINVFETVIRQSISSLFGEVISCKANYEKGQELLRTGITYVCQVESLISGVQFFLIWRSRFV